MYFRVLSVEANPNYLNGHPGFGVKDKRSARCSTGGDWYIEHDMNVTAQDKLLY